MTDRELLELALNALDGYARNCKCEGGGAPCDAAKALRARLARPEEPNWAAAGFSKPPKQQDRQCPSCGGFCKETGCERENVQPEQRSEQWWKHEVSNAWAEGYEKGRVMCGCGDQIMPDDGAECGTCVTARNAVKVWVGLTKEDKREIIDETEPEDRGSVMALVEAKLKDKNT